MEGETIILDNGGHTLKIGRIDESVPSLIPNSIVKSKHEKKRVFVAHEEQECTDKWSLFYVRPIERGYVVNWDTQQQIWERVFTSLKLETSGSRIAYTDNNYFIPALTDVSNEIFFEQFGFNEVFKASASTLVGQHSKQVRGENCICVVDAGFSWTTVASFVDGLLIQDSVVRIDVGGKALTNKLKDWISYRQINVTEETYVVNECKEALCFVATDFQKSLKEAKKRFNENTITKRYVLPDFESTFKGSIKNIDEAHDPSKPSVHLGVERFSIPEILFSPSDIDIDQCGVAEAVIESFRRCPEPLRPALAENIVIIGGSSRFPGFKERLHKDVRSMLPVEYGLKISDEVENPETYPWECAKQLLSAPNVDIPWINRKEWDERGDSLEYSKFFKTLLTSDELRERRCFEEQNEKTPEEDEELKFS